MKKVVIIAILLALCIVGGAVGAAYSLYPHDTDNEDTPAETKSPLVKLEDIYFPEGILDTGLGLYIWDGGAERWVRTTDKGNKDCFDTEKPTMVFAHGMGGNGTLSNEKNLGRDYNLLSFLWGTFSNEEGKDWNFIADKIWSAGSSRWIDNNGNLILDDVPNVSVAEIYGAYYYDFFSSFPDYAGSGIMIFGHSYGGMLTSALMSYLVTMYQEGYLPAYMVPDKINFLDPYFSRTKDFMLYNETVAWLSEEDQPVNGNVLETVYQAALACKDLGIAVGLYRTSKSVCYPCTLNYFGKDLTASYWNFCNNIVYAHISDNCGDTVENYTFRIHGYGWDWFTDYYTGYVLKDAAATTEEDAYCLAMPYDAMFFRSGIKYDVFLNYTERIVDDDIVTSFFCDYNTEINDSNNNEDEEILAAYKKGKAKIAGFAYIDANGNGKLDERVKDHFAGVKVTVKDSSGKEIYSAVTGKNGAYCVEVTEGNYTVSFSAPEGCEVSATEINVTITDGERQLAINNVAVSK